MKLIVILSLILLTMGCASGQLDLYNVKGEKVGECTAGYNWHPIGVNASVDWLLHYCVELAKNAGEEVHSVSDESILKKDYSYPSHPSGSDWNKQLAWRGFWSDIITKEQYGYIVAYLENVFFLETLEIQEQFDKGDISQSEYDDLIAKAEYAFHGS